MPTKTVVLFIIVALFFSSSCTVKLLVNEDQSKAKTATVATQAEQLVSCLNQRNYDCIYDLHADDFSGWSPVVKMEDKEVFIKKMVANYEQEGLQVKATILEFREGPQQGYVYLDWQLRSQANGFEPVVLLDKKCLQVWVKNDDKKWQLSRSLFY